MKAAQLFRQYIWIINALRVKGKLTLSQMNKMWMDDCMADGNPLARSSFNRHREAIQDLFGVVIDCEEKTYLYYISNPRVLSDDGLGPWLFSTMTVHGVLADSVAVKDRVVLEYAPAGIEYLSLILRIFGWILWVFTVLFCCEIVVGIISSRAKRVKRISDKP